MFKKNMSRALSVFLAVVMLAVAMPFAFAAEPVALTEANVVTWPTVNGEIYYGQKISDGITLNNDDILVTLDGTDTGTPIKGKFEFVDPDMVPTSYGSSKRANLKFVPADTTNYTGFEVTSSRDVTYKVNKTTPVFVDEENNPLVATEVEAGATLSASTLSGGQCKNPYMPNEPKALAKTWVWADDSTVVNESGTYQAKLAINSSYVVIYAQVEVKVVGDTPPSEIQNNPTVVLTYNPELTWSEVVLEGGKAVIKDTTTEVTGTFNVTDKWANVTPLVSTTEIDVKFTPTDETVALPIEFKCPVTVNKATPTFKTDDGSGVPTITMPYGTKLDSSLDYKLNAMVDVSVPVSFSYIDENGNDFPYKGTTPIVGTHEIQVKAYINDSNYEKYTMLTFKLEITAVTANCIMKPVGTQGYKIHDASIKYDGAKPRGTFTVSYTVDGVKQPDKTVKYEELFQVDMTKSGKYEFSVKYNEIENDPFEIADITYTDTVALSHNVSINGQTQAVVYNTAVTASAPATDPAQLDKPYYGFAGWEATGIELTEEQAASPEFSFTMPDNDVELKANYKFSIKLFFEWIWAKVVQFFNFIIYAVKDLFALATA